MICRDFESCRICVMKKLVKGYPNFRNFETDSTFKNLDFTRDEYSRYLRDFCLYIQSDERKCLSMGLTALKFEEKENEWKELGHDILEIIPIINYLFFLFNNLNTSLM